MQVQDLKRTSTSGLWPLSNTRSQGESNVSSSPLPATVTVWYGNNRLEISERVKSARSRIDPSGLSTSLFEQASSSIPDIASAVGSPGFFGSERLVICYDLIGPSSGSGRRRSRAKDSTGDSEPLAFLGSTAPGVRLIIVESALRQADERRLRGLASDIHIEEVQVPRGRALVDWTCGRARQYRAALDGATATRLVEALYPGTWRQEARRDDIPPDLHRIDAELQKLAVAAGEDGEITADLVSSLVTNADSLDVWGLSNAIADRDRSRAIKQLEMALETGQAPEMILAQLAAQFETFAIINAANGRPTSAVASATGLSEGRLRQASRASRNYTRVELARALSEIRYVDFATKQGKVEPEDALAGLVAQLAGRRSG
jgi:DNA polymerase III delta subunit